MKQKITSSAVGALEMAAPSDLTRFLNYSRWWPWILGLLSLASRFAYRSAPYFVDGPRHLSAIESSTIFIQAPGYFLFGETTRLLGLALHVQVYTALTIVNFTFSTFGVVVFAKLVMNLFPDLLGVLLSCCYAFSALVWFNADIQSTYCSMTFFIPALLYAIWVLDSWWLAGILWAAMAGFRPSDGIFAVPFLAYSLRSKGPRRILSFLATGLPVVALWYTPTVIHFGGNLLAPLLASQSQAASLANGLLTHSSMRDKMGSLIRIALALFIAWSLLAPFVFSGLFCKSSKKNALLIFIAPALLFYFFYYMADATYVTYLIAPGILIAGTALQRLRPHLAHAIAVSALLLSLVEMTVLRPVPATSFSRAILNSYYLEYSGWGIRHQYFKRLRDTQTSLK